MVERGADIAGACPERPPRSCTAEACRPNAGLVVHTRINLGSCSSKQPAPVMGEWTKVSEALSVSGSDGDPSLAVEPR